MRARVFRGFEEPENNRFSKRSNFINGFPARSYIITENEPRAKNRRRIFFPHRLMEHRSLAYHQRHYRKEERLARESKRKYSRTERDVVYSYIRERRRAS